MTETAKIYTGKMVCHKIKDESGDITKVYELEKADIVPIAWVTDYDLLADRINAINKDSFEMIADTELTKATESLERAKKRYEEIDENDPNAETIEDSYYNACEKFNLAQKRYNLLHEKCATFHEYDIETDESGLYNIASYLAFIICPFDYYDTEKKRYHEYTLGTDFGNLYSKCREYNKKYVSSSEWSEERKADFAYLRDTLTNIAKALDWSIDTECRKAKNYTTFTAKYVDDILAWSRNFLKSDSKQVGGSKEKHTPLTEFSKHVIEMILRGVKAQIVTSRKTQKTR